MPVSVDEDVLRLDVPVNDAHLVEVEHRQADLGEVELRLVFAHALELLELVEELAPAAELEHEDDEVALLEAEEHLDGEGVVDDRHDVALVLDELLFPVLQDELLVDELHGVEAAILLPAHQVNFRETSAADAFENLEVPQAHLALADLEEERLDFERFLSENLHGFFFQ